MTRRRYRRQKQQYTFPDWVWGLGLGLVVVVALGGYLVVTQVGGSGGGRCAKALPPLPGGAQVTAEGFQEEDVALGKVIDYLNRGDVDNAFANFYGPTHAFTHNIDPDVRIADETKAKELCETVITVETDFDPPPPGQRSLSRMAASAGTLRDHLRDIAELLGFPRPGG